MANIIAFSMGKGGVGKTTLAVNFSWYLSAVKGYKTLLVDWDPQASATMFFFEGDVPPDRSVARLFDMSHPRKILKSDTSFVFEAEGNKNLFIAPSHKSLSNAEQGAFELETTRRLKYWIDGTCRNIFDFVIVDCPPSHGRLTLNALMASDYVVIPTTAEPMSYDAIPKFRETVEDVMELNADLRLLAVVLNRLSENESAQAFYAKAIRALDLYAGTIHKSAALVTMSHSKNFICDSIGRANRRLLGEFEVMSENLLKRIADGNGGELVS